MIMWNIFCSCSNLLAREVPQWCNLSSLGTCTSASRCWTSRFGCQILRSSIWQGCSSGLGLLVYSVIFLFEANWLIHSKRVIEHYSLPEEWIIGSLSMQRFWGTDGNRKLTFRTPEPWSFLDFQTCGRYYWKGTEQYKCGGVKTT